MQLDQYIIVCVCVCVCGGGGGGRFVRGPSLPLVLEMVKAREGDIEMR